MPSFQFPYIRQMTDEQRNEVKQSIENSILTTQDTIASLKELTKPISPENAIGRVSRMDAINNKSVNEAALRNLTNKLALLKAALQRVNQQSFGLCISCNQPIPIQRILLMPQSNRCVNCASR
jgi:DnaK suppressor protein